jgi:nicotinamidase/pyrazinamidase
VEANAMAVLMQPGDAFLLVDVQRDFLPGGALAVREGDQVVPILNRYIALARRNHIPVFASRDWHPSDHCSFAARGGPWPPHCIAGTDGARIAADLELPDDAILVDKATTEERDAYSAFDGTGLARELRARGVKRLLVGGLATDYCVLNTVRDALAEGFEVVLLRDAIRPVDVKPGDGERAESEMRAKGAHAAVYADLAG